MMQQADTIGVFQIESRAQMATLPRMKPTSFYDVVIEVAIIRPGPIQGNLMHPYLARRKAVELGADPKMMPAITRVSEPVLERTLGVPLVPGTDAANGDGHGGFHRRGSGGIAPRIELSSFAGTHGTREDKIARRPWSAKGIRETLIDEIAKTVSSFALYGFPESHAISFAHLAYASAYLKAHRAPEFYASLLNNQPMGFYSSATLIKDGQRHGVKFLPVCVMRRSDWDCTD